MLTRPDVLLARAEIRRTIAIQDATAGNSWAYYRNLNIAARMAMRARGTHT